MATKTQANINFTERQLKWVDAEARRFQITRSEVLRRLLDRVLDELKAKAA